ncbi:hypothetical protein FB45DRAFT_689065, partial [Roridomyces roridus]
LAASMTSEADTVVSTTLNFLNDSSPVRRVPPEVLCEIFARVRPVPRRISFYEVEQPPWILGHICRLWRDTALACPRLW